MTSGETKQAWEQRLREHAARLEEEVRRVVDYINDEVVPDVRRHGSQALRAAASELHKLAERMDDHNQNAPKPPSESGS